MCQYEYEIFKKDHGWIYVISTIWDDIPLFPPKECRIYDSEGMARIEAISHIERLRYRD